MLYLRFALFSALIFFQTLQAQICDKKITVYFEKDRYAISEAEDQKLDKLCKIFENKEDTFMLEIHAFSDSIASDEYNYRLAGKRLKSIVAYLKKNTSAHFDIKEKVRGEAQPAGTNATEEGRAKNRRVDIFYWKLRDGKFTLKAKGGSEIDIDKDYFGSCGVCESRPKMAEIFTNEEAARQGISMTTTDGEELITGGMINLELSCPERTKKERNNDWPCSDFVIRIPSATYDPELEIWKVTRESRASDLRWERDEKGELTYDKKNKCYIMKVNYCPGRSGFRSGINLDKPRPVVGKVAPNLDSTGLVAVPELSRSRRTTNAKSVNTGRIYSNHAESEIMWGFKYKGPKRSVMFVDSGVAKNKIGYMFSGVIDRYEAECDSAACRTEKKCWCFEIPIDDYSKIIYFKKKKEYRLKVPFKYRKYAVRLFIPAADTLLPVTRSKGRKHTFKEPVPETYVVVYGEKADVNNKRAYDGQIYLGDIRTKYNKRKKHYKAKIKRRQLKKAISSNS